MTMNEDHPPFWDLGRISIALQVVLVVLVVVTLAITMQTLVNQTAEFGRQAEERAQSAEAAVIRAQAAIQKVTCILLIDPDERTVSVVADQCGINGTSGLVP